MDRHINTVTLHKIQLECCEYLSTHLLDPRCSIDLMPHLKDTFMVRWRGHLWGDKHPDKIVKWPATWWDAFKVDCFPDWAFDRWPPTYMYETFSFTTLYPDFKPSLPKEKSPMVTQCSHYKTTGKAFYE